MMTDITLDLPLPPSVNRTRRLNKGELWRVERWRENADKLVTAQWAAAKLRGSSRPGLGLQPFSLLIYVTEKYRGDLDNIIKAVPDYLRRIEVVHDDSRPFMREVILRWCPAHVAPEGIHVIISPVEKASGAASSPTSASG
jgi:Holliday junction resolvase RusA-like endonuclease